MARIVVNEPGKPPRAFSLDQPSTEIGRAEDVHLVLDHVSVSRHHAQIINADDGFVLADLGSTSGTWVNGERVTRHVLVHGDEVQIGKIVLVFHSDGAAPRPRPGGARPADKGEALKKQRLARARTYFLSPADIDLARGDLHLQANAEVVSKDDARKRWRPGADGLAFGGSGGIPVSGFAFGKVADLTWTGKAHQLKKSGVLGAVTVNGKAVDEAVLNAGDEFTVAKSAFSYEVPLLVQTVTDSGAEG